MKPLIPSTRALAARRFQLSVIAIVTSIFLFDIQATLIKLLGGDYPLPQLTFFRNFFGLFPAILMLSLSKAWKTAGRPLRLEKWKIAIGRGLILIAAQLCFYFSLISMELATATTLAFSGPLFITMLSVPLLGHSVGWWRGSAVAIGFVGVVLVLQPSENKIDLVMLLPVAAAFFYALASLSARFFDESVPTALITLYSSATTLCLSASVTMLSTGFQPVHSPTDWVLIAAMGSAGGFAVLLMILAYRMTEPGSLSPFEFFGIPFSFILGWLVFNETPFDRLFPGVILIVIGGLLVVFRERQLLNSKTD